MRKEGEETQPGRWGVGGHERASGEVAPDGRRTALRTAVRLRATTTDKTRVLGQLRPDGPGCCRLSSGDVGTFRPAEDAQVGRRGGQTGGESPDPQEPGQVAPATGRGPRHQANDPVGGGGGQQQDSPTNRCLRARAEVRGGLATRPHSSQPLPGHQGRDREDICNSAKRQSVGTSPPPGRPPRCAVHWAPPPPRTGL